MMARKKPLTVVEPVSAEDATSIASFEKPAAKRSSEISRCR